MIKHFSIACAAFGIASAAGAVNLVSNPSFEMSADPDTVKVAGSPDIAGWAVARAGGVFLASPESWDAASGDRSVELSGVGAGTIFQTVNLEVGKRYILSFEFALDPNATKNTVGLVSVNSMNQGFTAQYDPARTADNMLWETFLLEFIASSAANRLSFAGASSTMFGVTIDDIVLSVIPEPATWALMIAGFGMVGFASRRRRQISVSA